MSAVIICPRCGDDIPLRTSNSLKNPGRKYYAHIGEASKSCSYFSWMEDLVKYPVDQLRIYISSKRNYHVMLPRSMLATGMSLAVKVDNAYNTKGYKAIDKKIISTDVNIKTVRDKIQDCLLTHKIARINYIQTGRFTAKIEDNEINKNNDYKEDIISDDDLFPPSSYGESFTDSNKNSNKEANLPLIIEEVTTTLPSTCFQQISKSNLVFVAITESQQYDVVAEIQYAICSQIPVFIKFCNCDQYDVSSYSFIIQSIKAFIKSRTARLPDFYFQNIDVLKNWKSERDYIEYLETIPICIGCKESISCSNCLRIVEKENIYLDDIDYNFSHNANNNFSYDRYSCGDYDYGYDRGDLCSNDIIEFESVDNICRDCFNYLEGSIQKYVVCRGASNKNNINNTTIKTIILHYLGIEKW